MKHTQVSRDPAPAPQAGCAKEVLDALKECSEFLDHSGNQRSILSGKFSTPSARYDWFNRVKNAAHEALKLSAPPPLPVAEREWRPIETAPKDGTRIIGFAGNGSRAVAEIFWDEGCNAAATGSVHFRSAGWIASWINANGSAFDATHWQPLPAPPLLAEQGEKHGL